MKSVEETIKENKPEIMASWEKAVRKEIPASQSTEPLALRNLLPALLEEIAEVISRHEQEEFILEPERYEEIIRDSNAHGRHRATSLEYTVNQIIKEYIVLHQVMINFLKSKKVYDAETGIVLANSLEMAMAYSSGSFSDSLQEMREKLTGTLAHDIRNPISAAYTSVDMMKYSDGEERFNKVKNISLKGLRRSLDLLEGLLDAITVKAGQGITMDFSETDLIEHVTLVYDEATEIYSNNIKLVHKDEEIKGIMDGTAIKRALENLITNAVKYGYHDKPITIEVENSEEIVVLKVHNYGEPVSPEDQNKIFNFMNRKDSNPEGLQSWGMGLTLVKIVAEAHAGHVEVKSDKEDGTTFSIILHKYANKPGKTRAKLNFSR